MYHMRYHVKREGFALCFLSIYMRRAEDSDSVVRRLFIVAHTREPPSWQRPFDSAALRLAVTGGHLSWIWSDLPGQSCLALHCLCGCSFNCAKWSSAARSRAGKSAALRQAKTFSCSSRDAGCTRGRLFVLVGGWFLPPRRFNIADCPPSRSCVIGDDKSLPDEARRVGAWRARGARGGRQGGGRRGQNAPQNTSNATLRVNSSIADSFEKA